MMQSHAGTGGESNRERRRGGREAAARRRPLLCARRFRAALWLLAILPPLVLFGCLGRWGLPSRANDDLLFGGGPVWDASRLRAASLEEARRTRSGGADTDLDPLTQRDRIIDLTETEEQRAAILVRYRLYTHQPDEMITLMALARMNPRAGDFDPRLYQYGGLWISLSGAALVLLKPLLGLSFSLAENLDHPEVFARFYVVLRGLTMLFAIGLIRACQHLLVMAGSRAGALCVGPLLLLTPVFLCGVLEAKPHLPSVCMTLLTCIAALGMLRRPGVGSAIPMALAGGASLGLVLTGAAGGALWAALPIVDRRMRERRVLACLLAAGVGALVIYALVNPYLLYNGLFRPEVLASNVGNSTAMYRVGRLGEGLWRVCELMAESCGWPLLIVGFGGFLLLLRNHARETLIVAAPSLAMLLLAVSIGAGKPGEFARFLLLPACGVAICAAYLLGMLGRFVAWGVYLTVFVCLGFSPVVSYYGVFWKDSSPAHDTRRKAGEFHRNIASAAINAVVNTSSESEEANASRRAIVEKIANTIAVIQEPAPYSIPPLDFTRVRLLLLPETPPADMAPDQLPFYLIYSADDGRAHATAWWREYYHPIVVFPDFGGSYPRITWANKPVFVLLRGDAQTTGQTKPVAP